MCFAQGGAVCAMLRWGGMQVLLHALPLLICTTLHPNVCQEDKAIVLFLQGRVPMARYGNDRQCMIVTVSWD